jgi:hypothetical protein
MELFETDKRNVEMECDLFVSYGKKDSQGIRIGLKKAYTPRTPPKASLSSETVGLR